jgi:hypothetical protein
MAGKKEPRNQVSIARNLSYESSASTTLSPREAPLTSNAFDKGIHEHAFADSSEPMHMNYGGIIRSNQIEEHFYLPISTYDILNSFSRQDISQGF